MRVLEMAVAASDVGAVGTAVLNLASARSTAILGLVIPLISVTLTPEAWNAARIVGTSAVVLFCFMIAQAPATCGVAMEVPFHVPYPVPGTAEVIPEPGASRLRNEAELEYSETVLTVSRVAPTLTAVEIHAGEASEFL